MPTPRTLCSKSGDVHLACQAIGDGPRDVVLVLDWASHLEAVWEQPFIQEFIGSLNRYARVLWFDMRGVGLSDRVVEQAGATEDWMEDVVAVMDAASSDRATLIAHGHGVQMALMSAATHPDRVESLVLMNGFARFARAADYPAGMPPQAAELLLKQIERTWGTGAMAGPLGPSVASHSNETAQTTGRFPTRTCSARSRSSSPAPGCTTRKKIAFSRRSSSWMLPVRPSGPVKSVTGAGASFSTDSRTPSGARW